MLLKNTGSQGVYLFAYDTAANNAAKTGDAANITGSYSVDGAAAGTFGTAHPSEIGGGIYWQPLAQAETNGNALAFYWASGTTGIRIDPVLVLTSGANLPAAAPGGTGGLPTVDSGNGVKISVGSGTGQLQIVSGAVPVTGTVTLAAAVHTGATIPTTSSVTNAVTVGTNNDKTGYSLNLSQAVPTSNTAQTVGDALNAARAQGFGKWVLSGTTLTLYAADGTTAVRTFTLDSASTPTTRS